MPLVSLIYYNVYLTRRLKRKTAHLHLDYKHPLFSSLIRRARKKKTLASEKWPGENWGWDERAGKEGLPLFPGDRLAPQFSRGHFSLANVFFFLALQIKLEKRGCSSSTSTDWSTPPADISPTVGRLQETYILSVTCRPTVGLLSANCRLIVGGGELFFTFTDLLIRQYNTRDKQTLMILTD